ncbi:unnamed protein product [Cuscuta campestris]|uniref:Uncharacterized protein n=1 Tax=Cuscuta campestris TaxID=132261 RepID=A0A484KC99_9ASTE|nr:unnamed protein product [Cuscuta campestris]
MEFDIRDGGEGKMWGFRGGVWGRNFAVCHGDWGRMPAAGGCRERERETGGCVRVSREGGRRRDNASTEKLSKGQGDGASTAELSKGLCFKDYAPEKLSKDYAKIC